MGGGLARLALAELGSMRTAKMGILLVIEAMTVLILGLLVVSVIGPSKG